MRIMIGIPCYRDVSGEVLEDYMRFAYYCGRRLPQHEFLLAIKTKSEQFRARNAIVEGALQTGCDYLFFLDDDHVLDWEGTSGPNSRYGIVDSLIKHMDADPAIGIVGAVYYHRGNECRPVLMKEGKDGGYYYMRDDEITGQLQDVAVQGGGCMLIRLSVFDRIRAPWFEPEFDLGTDVQICKKVREAGYRVCSDTSIQIGHIMNQRMVVHPQNRHELSMDNARRVTGGESGIDRKWMSNSALSLYRMDAEEYLGMTMEQMGGLAHRYNMADLVKYKGNLREYYATRGKEQLARQVLFHHLEHTVKEMEMFHGMVNTQIDAYGLDFGCGSAPVTFELVMRGHKMDFVDVDGAAAYDFTKWRSKKRGVADRCGFKLAGPYDYVFMLDSLEHIEDWRSVLNEIAARLKDNQQGAFITNFFDNQDYANPEHVNMDKQAVKDHLISLGIYPVNNYLWVKNSRLGHMDKEAAA